MSYRVNITGPAKQDIRHSVDWWSEHRSSEEADRWYLGIYDAMRSLSQMPHRFGRADEQELADEEVRQMGFGLGRRLTHRVVYAVIEDQVIVYRVRSVYQDKLGLRDLES